MQKIQTGTRVKNLGINRLTCADGVKSRAFLIDPDPRVKHIAYDGSLKCRVEVNQDLIIKYGLRPYTIYLYLVGRLNTDMKGNVIGDDFVVEYLQFSESLYNDFADSVVEGGDFKSLAIQKVKKTGPQGQDFSYLKVNTSQYEVSKPIQQKLQQLRSTPEAIESMWNLIDRATSITPEEYEKRRANSGSDSLTPIGISSIPTVPRIDSGVSYTPPVQVVSDNQSISSPVADFDVEEPFDSDDFTPEEEFK